MDNDLGTIGIDDRFCRQIYQLLTCNSSAICFLVWDEHHDCNLDMHLLSHVQLIRTTLSVIDELDLSCKLGCI